jgi:glycosyltransferase involved in cell wall biosynthesis
MLDRAGSLRLVLIAASLGPGGAERVMATLANGWVRRGDSITIITLDGSLHSFFQIDSAIQRVAVAAFAQDTNRRSRIRHLFVILREALKLRRILRTTTPDAVLSFIDSTNVLMLLALLGTGYPRVVSERSDPAMVPLSGTWCLLRKILYPTADRIVVQTPGAAKFFDGWLAAKVAVIPNPVIVPRRETQIDVNVPRPAIVSLGRFTEEKRFDDLIEAFAMIAPRHSDWSLVIGGDGPLRSVMTEKVKKLGLEHRVLLPGLIKNSAALLERADIYVLSSRFEGFPNALCEAMALGRPVVATDCPSGPRAIVRHEVDGVLVPPLRPAKLAEAIERLIVSPAERKRLGAAATEIADRFKLDSILNAWDAEIRNAMLLRNGSSKVMSEARL